MDKQTYDTAHQSVSLELSNPFPTLGQFSLNKLKQFYGISTAYIQGIFRAKEEAFSNTLTFKTSTLVHDQLSNKQVVYTDIQPLAVYVPSVLKPNAYVLDYLRVLRADMTLTKIIMQEAVPQVVDMVNLYIGNPARLQDPFPTSTDAAHPILRLSEVEVEKLKKESEKYLTATGSQTTRPFKKAFARIVDFQASIDITKELYSDYAVLVEDLYRFIESVRGASDKINELLMLIQTHPDKYKIAAKTGDRLVQHMHALAKLAEFVAATLYNTQLVVKAMSDTIHVLENALETQ